MRNDLPPACRPEEMERNAYNAAFYELGLRWHWDSATWAALQCRGTDCVRHYLETEQPHLLRAYDAEFLVQAIERVKMEARRAAEGCGISAHFDWAQARGCELGA
jgi:hypothetical protein